MAVELVRKFRDGFERLPILPKWRVRKKHCMLVLSVFFLFLPALLLFKSRIWWYIEYTHYALKPDCNIADVGYGHVAHLSCPLSVLDDEGDNRSIILSFATAGWYPVAANWIVSMKKSRVHMHSTVVLVSLDKTLCPMLHNVTDLLDDVICFEALEHHMYSDIAHELQSSSGWGSYRYKRIISFRTQVIYSILLCNRTVLLNDIDVVYIKNPLRNLTQTLSKGGDQGLGPYDMLFQRDNTELRLVDYFEDFTVYGKWYVCAGFIFMTPSERTLHFWRTIKKYQEHDWNDQAGMNKCLILSRHQVRWSVLSSRVFRNGFHLKWNQKDHRLKAAMETYAKGKAAVTSALPYVVHFNWIHGVTNKMAAMSRHNLLFFRNETFTKTAFDGGIF